MIGITEMELVENEKLISDDEFMEIISMCQAFPGPIAITSTAFVGYKLYGLTGAIAALLGILLPSAIVIFIISSLLVELLCRSCHKWYRCRCTNAYTTCYCKIWCKV